MSTKSEMTVESFMSDLGVPSTSDYVSADRSEKAKMRGLVEKTIKSVLSRSDLDDGFVLNVVRALNEHLATFVTVRPEKSEKDYNGMVSAYLTALRGFADSVESGELSVPGVPDGFVYVQPEEPVSTDLVETYQSHLSSVRPFRSAVRNDIHGSIEQAFEGSDSGDFLTFGAIARKMGLPSSGAVSAAAARGDFPDNLDITPKSGSTGAGFTVR